MRRILYLRIPHFQSAVQALLDPALRGRPVIVAAGSYQRGKVMDVSPEAEAAGAERGMPWRHARRRCPEAALVRYERAAYAPVLEQIGNVIARATPWVEAMPGEEGAFFASLGEGSLEEGRDLALRIRTEIARELNLTARLGLATGKISARALVDCGWRMADGGLGDGVGEWEQLTIDSSQSGSPTPPLSHSPIPKSEIR